ncbi:retention module-containing protein, partial [Thauera sp.]|uniref:retention module-containing protein n=1 Tax=Thauera sp. TaxID=1905334 RepID=UPI002B5ADC2F
MAETTIVATVARVEGRAFARSTDGKLRALQEGDALREGEVVVTESGARVELVATGGGRIDLPAGGEVRITADLDEATRADAAAASVEEATVARVLEAIETGADLEQVLEDPAAGLAGGGGGDGSNFVRLLRIAEALSPVEVALETVEPASTQEFDGLADGGGARVGTADDPDVGVEEPVPPVPVLPETLSLQVAAPSLSADPRPTITGTSSAPAGSVVTVIITDALGFEQTLSTVVDAAGNFTIRPETPLADGTYGVTARITDTAGGVITASSAGAIDTVATIGVSLADVNAANVAAAPISGTTTGIESGRTVTLVVSDADPATPDVTVTAVINPDGSYSTTANLSGLIDGPLSVTVSASDAAGNTATSSGTASLDTSAGITVSLADVNAANAAAAPIGGTTTGIEPGQVVTLVVSDTDPATPDVTVTAVINPDGSYSTTADLSGLSDGPLTVTASVADAAGNVATANDT